MGQALVKGLVEKSVYPQNLSIFDLDKKKTEAVKKETHVKLSKSARQCASLSDVIILAVKPKDIQGVAEDISSVLTQSSLVISIAAGVPIAKIEAYFGKPVSVVRVMPNMPALVGVGMSAISLGKHATEKHRRIAEAIFNAIGEVLVIQEKFLDLVTAVSGSGPAYFFLLAEKLIEAAYEMGMKAETAKRLVYQTALGSGKVLVESGEDPEDLIERVASKGGTTESALKVFQKQGIGKIIQDAVKAAYQRSKEISKGE
ncbi:MAG: pyrroline-5-carboxylate reductase [Candidatus Omnitrophica bacterium CG1_02_46_14]|nr:MAG: pyrroline-5-carboxylate reductase [Candidatus Omnitrophica bacterium CG1_02_46_14]